jgi:hypothetical protein
MVHTPSLLLRCVSLPVVPALEERTPRMAQNARTRLAVSLRVFALSLLVLLCFAMLPAPAGGGEGPGYTAVDDNKGCCFKKSPKMATFESYARVCAIVEL